MQVISLSGKVPFEEQLNSVRNSTVLLAGRGGGTGLSMFLPSGGIFLSVSGSDRWNPTRDLVPSWISLVHYEAQMVHHESPKKPPLRFSGGAVDANRCGYVVNVTELIRVLKAALDRGAELALAAGR